MIISEGTLRNEDLIPRFADELERRAPPLRSYSELIAEARALTDYNSDDANEIIMALHYALDDVAPEGMYFGTHEGDGACFGFWGAGE